MDDNSTVRLDCLKLAVGGSAPSLDAISLAAFYADFVLAGNVPPTPEQVAASRANSGPLAR